MKNVNVKKNKIHNKPTILLPQSSQIISKAELVSNKDIPQKLMNVLMMYEEMFNNNKSYTEAYKELTRRRGLKSEHTIPDSCTRGLGLNTSEFKALVMVPDKLAAFLVERFPEFKGYISEIISWVK